MNWLVRPVLWFDGRARVYCRWLSFFLLLAPSLVYATQREALLLQSLKAVEDLPPAKRAKLADAVVEKLSPAKKPNSSSSFEEGLPSTKYHKSSHANDSLQSFSTPSKPSSPTDSALPIWANEFLSPETGLRLIDAPLAYRIPATLGQIKGRPERLPELLAKNEWLKDYLPAFRIPGLQITSGDIDNIIKNHQFPLSNRLIHTQPLSKTDQAIAKALKPVGFALTHWDLKSFIGGFAREVQPLPIDPQRMLNAMYEVAEADKKQRLLGRFQIVDNVPGHAIGSLLHAVSGGELFLDKLGRNEMFGSFNEYTYQKIRSVLSEPVIDEKTGRVLPVPGAPIAKAGDTVFLSARNFKPFEQQKVSFVVGEEAKVSEASTGRVLKAPGKVTALFTVNPQWDTFLHAKMATPSQINKAFHDIKVGGPVFVEPTMNYRLVSSLYDQGEDLKEVLNGRAPYSQIHGTTPQQVVDLLFKLKEFPEGVRYSLGDSNCFAMVLSLLERVGGKLDSYLFDGLHLLGAPHPDLLAHIDYSLSHPQASPVMVRMATPKLNPFNLIPKQEHIPITSIKIPQFTDKDKMYFVSKRAPFIGSDLTPFTHGYFVVAESKLDGSPGRVKLMFTGNMGVDGRMEIRIQTEESIKEVLKIDQDSILPVVKPSDPLNMLAGPANPPFGQTLSVPVLSRGFSSPAHSPEFKPALSIKSPVGDFGDQPILSFQTPGKSLDFTPNISRLMR